MADIIFPDGSSPIFNPAAYSEAGAETRKAKGTAGRQKTEKVKKRTFASFFEKAPDTVDQRFPLSEESLHLLLDGVHETGEVLSKRPFPEEIKAYRQAVKNFVNYVVENSFDVEQRRSRVNRQKGFTLIQVIDKKLEELASAILLGQADQLAILARTDEIKGLLIDLSS